jgi:hypothetical protein
VTEYDSFLKSKVSYVPNFGHKATPVNPLLFDFEQAIVEWAVLRGKAAIFADCGMGKTLMQLEWARQSGPNVLIVAPIAVAQQTIEEGKKIGVVPEFIDRPCDRDGVWITNYEKLKHFVGHQYDAIVLDESGILKSLDGKTRTMLLNEFTNIPRRLCCTATPAPNDISELANHAQFLGVMSRTQMLAQFFVHDSDESGDKGWRLKRHAEDIFWQWVSRWGLYIRKPSDLGFPDGKFILPDLNVSKLEVGTNWKPEGVLFHMGGGGLKARRSARKGTIDERVKTAATKILGSSKQWIVWCGLNQEGDMLEKALGDKCVQIAGKDSDEDKLSRELIWRSGKVQTLITKAKIFGWGMNWQCCHNMLFLGIGDSYEQYYQAIRRCWRFGQTREVNVLIVASSAEQDVVNNVNRKEIDAASMSENIVKHAEKSMKEAVCGIENNAKETYDPKVEMNLPQWEGWTK